MRRMGGPVLPAPIAGPLNGLIERVCSEGGFPPVELVFFDREGRWFEALASLPRAERRRLVAVAETPERIETALRWSCGGAILLPPSLHRVRQAVAAAGGAGGSLPDHVEWPDVVDELGLTGLRRVDLFPRSCWERLHSHRERIEILAGLARALECCGVLTPGPSMVLNGGELEEIRAAWAALPSRPRWASDAHLAVDGDVLGKSAPESGAEWRPVSLWPEGAETGRWRVADDGDRLPWCLEIPDGRRVEALPVRTPEAVVEATGHVCRIVGIPGSELALAGSPGSVLAEAVARTAEIRGCIAWIPNVPRSAMPIIRNWGIEVWVDGPAVGDG